MLCRCDYSERIVASFAHQIKSEYYGGTTPMSIEGIALEHFSELPQTEIKASTKSCTRHAVFHYFCRMIANNMLPLQLHTEKV